MKPSLQKLQKIFKLEADRGYDNRAVLGGLERMLDYWVAEARADEVPEDLIQAVIHRLHEYVRLTAKSRAETLEGIWRRVQRSTSPVQPENPQPSELPLSKGTDKTRVEQDTSTIEQKTSSQPLSAVVEIAPEIETAAVAPQPVPVEKPLAAYKSVPPEESIDLDEPITILPGIGEKYALSLRRLGINNLRDMLYYVPRRYDDYSTLKPINRLDYHEQASVIGTVHSIHTRLARNGTLQVVEAIITDGSGSLRVNWYNQPHIAKRLHPGMQVSLSGKTDQFLGRTVMNNPEWEPLDQVQLSTNRIVPVYSLTAGVHQNWLRRVINQAVLSYAPRISDPLPGSIREKAGLIDLPGALVQIHYPDSDKALERAQDRLSFDEIFLLQLGVLQQKHAWQDRSARVYTVDDTWLENQLARLPYPLTGAQLKVLNDIRQDLSKGHPMNRLVQGDVGSGKTVVAALGMAMVMHSGAQAAIMAPTSILAEQHYKNLVNLLAAPGQVVNENEDEAPTDIVPLLQPEQIRYLVGSTPENEKQEIRQGILDGSIKLLVGTHALLEDPIQFADLQFVVIDEQHRFGVTQRAALRKKGENAHLLVMTATPIPRTLALSIYGDLDLSVIDEMPAGRLPVSTHVLFPRERERAYSLIRSQVSQGQQAFIIYPLVEESETSETLAAVEEHKRLQNEIFPRLKVGLLHGRMKPEEKEAVMAAFHHGQSQILVSTTVVEVGVDVPNATIMLIEGANRFGLAQLHQLRGRVGRGSDKSYCLLIPDSADDIENERLMVMAETNDGFVLAERDLNQRGPGQFLGTRQSGYTEFQLANLTKIGLIEKSRRLALELYEKDPELKADEHKLLAQALQKAWTPHLRGDIS